MIREISKSDWKLFRQKIGEWQEGYMARLNEEYIKLLKGDEPASVKFWNLDERIRRDKNTPGVRLELRKSETAWNIAHLINDGVITEADITEFSDDLKEWVSELTKVLC